MMEKVRKSNAKIRLLSILMVFVIIGTCIEPISISAITRNEVQVKLDSLIQQYNGTTWNDYYYGIQCKGFANLIFSNLFGVYIGPYDSATKSYIPNPNGAYEVGRLDASHMSLEGAKNILLKGSPGDYIQVRRRNKTYGHSMILVGTNSNGITVFDCNSDGKNGVRYYSIDWNTFYNKNSAMSLYHANNYTDVDTCNCNESYKGEYTVTTSSQPLMMRSGHGKEYSVIASIPKGEKVYVSKADGSWAHVEWNGYSGYCSMEYLTKIESAIPDTKIRAWISDDKMGEIPENYKLGKSYYLCYEVIDSSTGKRLENANCNYTINETFYGPDGGVIYTCDYENSNNNWIRHSTYVPGTYRGVVTISGDYEGSVEVTYTLDEVKPQMRAWVSKEKMGDTIETTENGEMFYLCYEVRDKNSERKLNEVVEADYTVTETIYRPDGSVAHTYNYENSDYNWIGHKALEAGTYQCTVTISGAWNGTLNAEIVVKEPMPEATETPKVTNKPATPIPTTKPIIVSTKKPQITTQPTVIPTVKPTDVPVIITTSAAVGGTAKPIYTSTPIVSTLPPVTLTEMPKMTSVPAPVVTPTVEPIQTTEPTTAPVKDIDEDDLVDIDSDENQMDSENVLEEGDIFEANGGIYEIIDASTKNPKVEYVGASSNKVKTVIIPEKVTYETVEYKVVGIGRNAFKNNKKLTAVTIGSNVTYIGAYAFYGNSKLKTIKIKSKQIKRIQKKAFWGVTKKASVKVPASVKNKYIKMLKKAGLGKR